MTTKGVKVPITFGGSGGLIAVEESEKIGQNLTEIVRTRLGSRVMEPEVGSASMDAVHRSYNSPSARASLTFTISQLKSEESRAIINSQDVIIDSKELYEGNAIYINIPWLWRQDAQTYNATVEL